MEKRGEEYLCDDTLENIFLRGLLSDVRRVGEISRRWRKLFPSIISKKWAHYSPCLIRQRSDIQLGRRHSNSTDIVAFNKKTKIWECVPLQVPMSKDGGYLLGILGARLRGAILVQVCEAVYNSHARKVVYISNIFKGDCVVLPGIEGFISENNSPPSRRLSVKYKLKGREYDVNLDDILLSCDSQQFSITLIFSMYYTDRYRAERFVEFQFQSCTGSWTRRLTRGSEGGLGYQAVGIDGDVLSFCEGCGVLRKITLNSCDDTKRGQLDMTNAPKQSVFIRQLPMTEACSAMLVMVDGVPILVTFNKTQEGESYDEISVYEVNADTKQVTRVSYENMIGKFGVQLNCSLKPHHRCSSDGQSIFVCTSGDIHGGDPGEILVYSMEKKEWGALAVDQEFTDGTVRVSWDWTLVWTDSPSVDDHLIFNIVACTKGDGLCDADITRCLAAVHL